MRAVNLLPVSRRTQEGGNRPGSAYIALGALGVLLLATVMYVLSANGLTKKQDELAKVEAETQAAQQQAAALGSFGDFASIKQTREDSITRLAQSRLDWERLVRELSRVVPADVSISTLDATAAGATDGEAAGGQTPGGPSLKLAGCAPSQPDVATFMVRLRKLHRADEVTLASSARAGGESVGSGGCGTGYGFTVSVTFDPATAVPAAEEVPAQLGGGA